VTENGVSPDGKGESGYDDIPGFAVVAQAYVD
jgi:hypothetical protein